MEHPPSSANLPAYKRPDNTFKPHDVLDDTAKAGVVGGLSGLFLSSIKNAMAKNNVGILSVFTRGSYIIGLGAKRMPIVVGLGSGLALFQGTFHYLGGRYDSFKREGDEFERKEIVRRSTRLPIEQTISEIGEGRGIRPPGYAERRAERLSEKYGVEINPIKATVEGSQ
ncbi:Putative NADH2 dehydrogenase Ubiquinone chain [Fusarium acuminatum]|uniref:NADH2 dehydrogenase Ubiquinone chain n=1 Tax=Fusarium acuminatum TaxID=5515 RepID=A0ABZ2X0Z3_9HYPO